MKGDNERVCANNHITVIRWTPYLVVFEPGTSWSKGRSTYYLGPVVQGIATLMNFISSQNVNCSSKYNI